MDYVIYQEDGAWKGTSESNYCAKIRNESLITDFEGFENEADILEYMLKYYPQIKNIKVVVSL